MRNFQLLFIIAALVISGLLLAKTAEAGTEHNLCGWAWADPETVLPADSPGTNLDIGWISFNNLNCDGTVRTSVDFGVNVNLSNGKFSGRAWSGGGDGTNPNQGVGWISFERSETGAPPYDDPCPDGSCIAILNPDNTVSGWARALSACPAENGNDPDNPYDDPCVSPTENAGGWDGWIKMKGTGYGVSKSGNDLTGWAWAGDVTPGVGNALGWIKFHQVSFLILPPSATLLDCGEDNPANPLCYIDPCLDALHPRLSFEYSDPNSPPSPVDFYQIQISKKTPPAWGAEDLVLDKIVYLAPHSYQTLYSYQVLASDLLPGESLLYNKTYFWRLAKIKNELGAEAGPFGGGQFTTKAHAYPDPDFTHSPQNPSVGEIVTFTDTSTCYDSVNNPYPCKNNAANRYQWDFEDNGIIDCDSNIDSTCRGDVTHIYTDPGNYTVRLFITDDLGLPNTEPCGGTGDSPVGTSPPLPEWREIPPTGWIFPKLVFQNLGKFLNSIFGFLI